MSSTCMPHGRVTVSPLFIFSTLHAHGRGKEVEARVERLICRGMGSAPCLDPGSDRREGGKRNGAPPGPSPPARRRSDQNLFCELSLANDRATRSTARFLSFQCASRRLQRVTCRGCCPFAGIATLVCTLVVLQATADTRSAIPGIAVE